MAEAKALPSRSRDGRRIGSRALPWPWIWIVVGTCALLVGGLGSAQYRLALSRAPLLRDPSGLVVDASGRIYCGVADSRIHVYDAEGRIVRAWPVESGAGAFRLRLAAADSPAAVEVATERTGLLLAYDREGDVVSRTEDPEAFGRFGDANERSYSAADGARYTFEGTALVRRDSRAARVVVPPIPIPLRWFAGTPWMLVAIFVLGPIALLGGLVQRGRIATPRAGQESR